MNFDNLIKIEQIRTNVNASSKKKVLETISQIVSECYPQYQSTKIFETLVERERLGSTGIGHGVALPHGRLSDCKEPIGIFISLTEGVDFDAIDQQDVKLIFALLVPENSTQAHLQILAKLAEFFRQEENRQTLNNAASSESIYQLLINL
ncbi:MAG: PTS IIA-like nitrogen regulatory protein PtsN [gamma proteobacterium symbiont of Taylorina sp.]|nr:PTS IIA-like nitrogen regulatory protein PtsN [gamma proteobacterium symbiont of Taylorina sp.]